MTRLASALLVLAIATVTLHRSAFEASDLYITPDAIEYGLTAHRVVFEGRYALIVAGRDLPPRYPPWFSLFVVAPAYMLLGPEPGNAIFPVTALGVCGALLARAVGRRAGGVWGGTCAALAVLALPAYRFWGRQVMTDVPTAALLLGACLLYLRIRAAPQASSLRYLASGAVIGAAAAIRPVCAAAVIPFLLPLLSPRPSPSLALRRLLALVGPLALVMIAGGVYNARAFGSAFRNGYQFWCSVPYDYFAMTFSASYVTANAAVLWKSGLVGLLAAAAAAWLARRFLARGTGAGAIAPGELRGLVEFLVLATGPMLAFHLVYFFPQDRFFLPQLVLAATLVGALAGRWLERVSLPWHLGALVAVLAVAIPVTAQRDEPPQRRLAVDRIRAATPRDAWVVTAIDPPYIEYLLGRESRRTIVPMSRRIEYANKVLTARRIPSPDPPPQGWSDHRCPGLLRGGAEEAVPLVAEEQLGRLAEEVDRGSAVFFDSTFLDDNRGGLAQALEKRFRIVEVAPFLFRLDPAPGN